MRAMTSHGRVEGAGKDEGGDVARVWSGDDKRAGEVEVREEFQRLVRGNDLPR